MSVSLAGNVLCVKYPSDSGEFYYFYKVVGEKLIKYKRLYQGL
jgi:hypothetical protein